MADGKEKEGKERSSRSVGSVGRPSESEISQQGTPLSDRETSSGGPLGTVYILETTDKRLVKVGYSTALTMRLDQHRRLVSADLACDVRLIGFFPGTFKTEADLHRAFAPYRVHAEWYERQPVLDHIRKYGYSYKTPVETKRITDAESSVGQTLVAIRNRKLSPEQRHAIAKKAAAARWGTKAGK